MLTAIKYRAYPNAAQQRLLAQMFGNQRFVWNHFLAAQKQRLDSKQGLLSYFDMTALLSDLRREYSWLAKSKVDSLRTALEALDNAFTRFFRKQSRFPKFKDKWSQKSVTTTKSLRSSLSLNRRLGAIPISEHRPTPKGVRKRLTISCVPSGRYFLSVTVETGESPPEPALVSRVIGVDEGLTDFLTLSTGRKIKHGKHYRANLLRLKREQQRLARKTKGSNRRERQRIKVAWLQEKIANARNYEIHLISTNLVRKAVRESQAIAFQKSDIVGQMKNRYLALSIGDASWGEFRRQLAYKCARTGVPLLEVDQWEPTSYPCHVCGVKAQGKTLADRRWICVGCGAVIDRDRNAALNIARCGLEQLRRREASSTDVEGWRSKATLRSVKRVNPRNKSGRLEQSTTKGGY